MAKVWVYAEMSGGKLQSTALELMVKARELGDVEAIALGSGAKAAASTLGKHGAKGVRVNEEQAFDVFIAEPAADALTALHEQSQPDLILFAFTSDSRDIAGRLAARLGKGLISNAGDVEAKDGGFVAKVPYFGGAKMASMRANSKPAIVLVRPKSFEASETGGSGQGKVVPDTPGDGSQHAEVAEAASEPREKGALGGARVVASRGAAGW